LGLILAIIRVPLVVFLFLVLWLSETILSILPLRFLIRCCHVVVIRLLLFFMGFWSLDVCYARSTRRSPHPSSAPGSGIPKGHVLIANHCSYIDILYLAYQFSPVFTAAPNDWPAGKVVNPGVATKQSLIQALRDTINQPRRATQHCSSFDAIVSSSNAPVVLFPEATTTNGNVLLGCVPVLTETSKIPKNNMHILAFKYPYTDFSPVYTVGSFLYHIIKLCMQISNTLQVTYVIDNDIAIALSSMQVLQGGGEIEWPEKLYNILAGTMGKRRAQIMANAKHPFNTYWYEYEKGYKKK